VQAITNLLNSGQERVWIGSPYTHVPPAPVLAMGIDSVLAGLMQASHFHMCICMFSSLSPFARRHRCNQQPHGSNQHFSTPLPESDNRVNLGGSDPFYVQRGGRHRVWVMLFDGDEREAANGDEVEGR
jgi:hypothetical protein